MTTQFSQCTNEKYADWKSVYYSEIHRLRHTPDKGGRPLNLYKPTYITNKFNREALPEERTAQSTTARSTRTGCANSEDLQLRQHYVSS